MINYLVIGTSINGGDIYFNKQVHPYLFGAIGELVRIAEHKQDDGYNIDLQVMDGQLLVTDNQDNLVEVYKIYEAYDVV